MSNILAKIQDDIDEYLDLCKRFNETPVYRKNEKVFYDKNRYNVEDVLDINGKHHNKLKEKEGA
jgi:hypothetical protein